MPDPRELPDTPPPHPLLSWFLVAAVAALLAVLVVLGELAGPDGHAGDAFALPGAEPRASERAELQPHGAQATAYGG
jgi:hypothetical protein